MKGTNKACPIVFGGSVNTRRILVFRHPTAGIQLCKGTIEAGESPRDAALRELREEAGICDAVVNRDLGTWETGFEEQVWSLHVCKVNEPLPDAWEHYCEDDTGHVFQFFWHPFSVAPSSAWHPLFRSALAEIKSRLSSES